MQSALSLHVFFFCFSSCGQFVLGGGSIGGDLAPSLGDGKNFADQNEVFLGKNFHFHAQNFL